MVIVTCQRLRDLRYACLAQLDQQAWRNRLSAPGKRGHSPRFRLDLMPYLFILPAVIIYVIFNLGPVLASFFLSFFRWDLLSPTTEFIGFKHYDFILNDDRFWNALSHNFIFLILAVIIPSLDGAVPGGIHLRNSQGTRRSSAPRCFLPAIFSGVVIAYVWKWIYHPFAGVLNPTLELDRSWAHSRNPGWAIPRIALVFNIHRLYLGQLRLFDGHFSRWLARYLDRDL